MNRRLFLGLPLLAYAKPQDLRKQIPIWMQYGSVPGAWVTVIERGKIAWEQGFGVRNSETKQPVDSQTIFEAASLTKQVTAHVAHALAKEGKLDFDKPLLDYVAGLTDPVSKTVTARHVLSHSSGWPNWRGQKGEPLVPQFRPGSAFRYSGEGYVYLSRVIEKVADASFMELVQARVFDPLGMSSSSMVRRLDRADRMASGHNPKGEVRDGTIHLKFWELAKAKSKPVLSWRYEDVEAAMAEVGQPPLPNMMIPNAAASMCTTGPDYARFLLNAIKNPLLRERVSTIREGAGWSLGWGLGWGVEQVAGRQYLWQWGDNGGYKAFVIVDPVAESGAFVFTNGNNGQRLCDRIVTQTTGVEHPSILWLS